MKGIDPETGNSWFRESGVDRGEGKVLRATRAVDARGRRERRGREARDDRHRAHRANRGRFSNRDV